MRARALLLLTFAVVLAGGTAWLAREWLVTQRLQMSQSGPMTASKPSRSVLIAHAGLKRGQILRPEDLIWQVWPDGGLDKTYIELGGPRSPDAFAGWHFWSSIGSYIFAAGLLIWLYGIVVAFTKKELAGNNPWGEGATTLEWTLSSPPPFHQFETLPRIDAGTAGH